MSRIQRIEVVIPARDEEATIGAALVAVDVAAALVGVPTRIHVVLDGCVDGSLDVVLATPVSLDVVVVAGGAGTVGAARALGVARAALGCDPQVTWIASTDADSTVAPDWLVTHVALADAGVGAVAGMVTVADWSMRPPALPELFLHRYERHIAPAPVHGANLGVRLDAYLAAGGFPALACGEDAALVGALRIAGTTIAYTTASPVTTSARRDGRAYGGFADTLTAWSCADEPAVERQA